MNPHPHLPPSNAPEPPDSHEFRRLAGLLRRAEVPPIPADFARRLQQRVDDLGEQARGEVITQGVLAAAMVVAAATVADPAWLTGWWSALSLPAGSAPMLVAAALAAAAAWWLDRRLGAHGHHPGGRVNG